MEEEKDQLIKRVERLKKRVRHAGSLFEEAHPVIMPGTHRDSQSNESITSHTRQEIPHGNETRQASDRLNASPFYRADE